MSNIVEFRTDRQARQARKECVWQGKSARMRRVPVECPGCGETRWFKVPVPTMRAVESGLLVAVTCTARGCGADVPLYMDRAA